MSDVLRIIDLSPIVFNASRKAKPKNSLRILGDVPFLFCNGVHYTTLAGTVKDTGGSPLIRTVKIYGGENMAEPLGVVESANDGTWSIEVIGTNGDKFVAVAQGEDGENFHALGDILGAPVS